MARAFAGPRSLKALGTYNFAGDIGKMSVPAAAALLLTVMTWQPAVMLLGVVGLAGAAAIFLRHAALWSGAAVETTAGPPTTAPRPRRSR